MLTPSRRARIARPRKARLGFGLVELIVAIMILSIGVLGLASTAAYVTRQVNEGGQATFAAARVQTLLDSLRATSCSQLVDGSISPSLANKNVEQVWDVTPGPAGSGRSFNIELSIRWITQRGYSRSQQFTMSRPCLRA